MERVDVVSWESEDVSSGVAEQCHELMRGGYLLIVCKHEADD